MLAILMAHSFQVSTGCKRWFPSKAEETIYEISTNDTIKPAGPSSVLETSNNTNEEMTVTTVTPQKSSLATKGLPSQPNETKVTTVKNIDVEEHSNSDNIKHGMNKKSTKDLNLGIGTKHAFPLHGRKDILEIVCPSKQYE